MTSPVLLMEPLDKDLPHEAEDSTVDHRQLQHWIIICAWHIKVKLLCGMLWIFQWIWITFASQVNSLLFNLQEFSTVKKKKSCISPDGSGWISLLNSLITMINFSSSQFLTSFLCCWFSLSPMVEVQRCGTNSEDQRSGWFGAGEEVRWGDGKHAAQKGGSCWGKPWAEQLRKTNWGSRTWWGCLRMHMRTKSVVLFCIVREEYCEATGWTTTNGLMNSQISHRKTSILFMAGKQDFELNWLVCEHL